MNLFPECSGFPKFLHLDQKSCLSPNFQVKLCSLWGLSIAPFRLQLQINVKEEKALSTFVLLCRSKGDLEEVLSQGHFWALSEVCMHPRRMNGINICFALTSYILLLLCIMEFYNSILGQLHCVPPRNVKYEHSTLFTQ